MYFSEKLFTSQTSGPPSVTIDLLTKELAGDFSDKQEPGERKEKPSPIGHLVAQAKIKSPRMSVGNSLDFVSLSSDTDTSMDRIIKDRQGKVSFSQPIDLSDNLSDSDSQKRNKFPRMNLTHHSGSDSECSSRGNINNY